MFLVNSGNDFGMSGNANSQAYPPLGIISLATHLQAAFGHAVEVVLFDGQIDLVETIVEAFRRGRPDVVGISMYCTSVRNCVTMVREAKGVGATTVLGNDHAAFHHEILLRKISELDFVCTVDVGESSLVSLVGHLLGVCDLREVRGMAFRHGGEVIDSQEKIKLQVLRPNRPGNALDNQEIPDRSLLPRRYWQHYLNAFRNQRHCCFDPMKIQGVSTINRARGCGREKNPCAYCGIADLSRRASSPKLFWADVRSARTSVGANYLYEAFDSATSWPGLIRSWAEAKPDDLADTRFMMYAQALETTPEVVKLFESLGVACINSGFDSGDNRTLKLLKGPRDSVEANRAAAIKWTDAGIEIYTSFVLVGLGDEATTRRSLDNTVEFAEWLNRETATVSIQSALLYPDKPSVVGKWIWNPVQARHEAARLGWGFINFDRLDQMHLRWRDEIFLDVTAMADEFAEVCGVDPGILVEYALRIGRIRRLSSVNETQTAS